MQKSGFAGFPLKDTLNITHITSLFYHKAPKNFKFKGERHPIWEMIYVDKGKMVITAGEATHILKAGECAFHKPGEFHAVQAVDNTAANFFVVAFASDSPVMSDFEGKFFLLNTRERGYLYDAYRYSQKAHKTQITPGRITEENQGDEAVLYSQAVKSFLELLFISLLLRKDSPKETEKIDTYSRQLSDKHLITDIENYLEDHINENLTIEQIAKDFNCSASLIKKVFQKAHKGGIINYFIDLKIDEAKRLITESELTVSQVSDKLSFQNPSYFARIFKKRVGMTPSEFGLSYKENLS